MSVSSASEPESLSNQRNADQFLINPYSPLRAHNVPCLELHHADEKLQHNGDSQLGKAPTRAGVILPADECIHFIEREVAMLVRHRLSVIESLEGQCRRASRSASRALGTSHSSRDTGTPWHYHRMGCVLCTPLASCTPAREARLQTLVNYVLLVHDNEAILCSNIQKSFLLLVCRSVSRPACCPQR